MHVPVILSLLALHDPLSRLFICRMSYPIGAAYELASFFLMVSTLCPTSR